MLIQFSVKNYKTFKDKATLSLVASNSDKDTREEDNIIYVEKFNLRLLKSAVIYGANASGKTKLFEALYFMQKFVVSSSKDTQKSDEIQVDNFKLSSETDNLGSEFEIVFLFNNEIYRYGFEVDKQKVIAEWLYYKPNTKEIELFYRDNQNFEIHKKNFSNIKLLIDRGLVRENALLLSVAVQFNDGIANTILDGFARSTSVVFANDIIYHKLPSMNMMQTSEGKEKILEFMKFADLGIDDIQRKESEINLSYEKEKVYREIWTDIVDLTDKVYTSHKKFDQNKKYIVDIKFSLADEESFGTKKFFEISGFISVALLNGFLLVIDELDSKLHPNLVEKIISLFNSKEHNPNNAQLIFNTQDSNLLNSKLFRRDQIWFTEKDKYGAAKLYSLADFKTDAVRKNEAFEENYLRGKYGAIPYLGDFDSFTPNMPLENENAK